MGIAGSIHSAAVGALGAQSPQLATVLAERRLAAREVERELLKGLVKLMLEHGFPLGYLHPAYMRQALELSAEIHAEAAPGPDDVDGAATFP